MHVEKKNFPKATKAISRCKTFQTLTSFMPIRRDSYLCYYLWLGSQQPAYCPCSNAIDCSVNRSSRKRSFCDSVPVPPPFGFLWFETYACLSDSAGQRKCWTLLKWPADTLAKVLSKQAPYPPSHGNADMANCENFHTRSLLWLS